MSDTIAKSVEKAGISISKEKFLEVTQKSPHKEFSFLRICNTKDIVILSKPAKIIFL